MSSFDLDWILQHPARVLGVLAAAIAGISFAGAGLFGDDTAFLLRYIPSLESWAETWDLPPAFRDWFGALHRPLSIASWRLDHILFGEQWAGYHWHQALWYGALVASFTALASEVLLLLGPDLGERRRLRGTWVLGSLFAVHPAHVETAAWLATRHDVLFATFLCAALVATFRCLRNPNPSKALRWAILAGVLGFLSTQAKETGFVFFPLVSLICLQVAWRGDLPNKARALNALWPSAIGLLAGFLLRSSSGTEAMLSFHPEAFTRWLSAAGWALDFSLLPWGPRLFHPHPPAASGWLALSLSLVWFVVGWKRRKHDGLSLFGLIFVLLTLAPTWMVAFQPLMETLVADRYLLLPLGGLLLALGRPLSMPGNRVRSAVFLIGFLWLGISAHYAWAWAGPPQALGLHAARHAPESVEARVGGIARALRTDNLKAAKKIRDMPPKPTPFPGRSSRLALMDLLIALEGEEWNQALAATKVLTKENPRNPSRWHEQGEVYWSLFLSKSRENPLGAAPKSLLFEAEVALNKAVQLDPRHFRSWLALGHVWASLGRTSDAREAFSRVLHYGGSTAEAAEAKKMLKQL
ncbi:MAG: hypothetical protein QF389_02845 [Planctomycetota bacterium]|nr:hypothetical protein [Planctomycetota bacterium]